LNGFTDEKIARKIVEQAIRDLTMDGSKFHASARYVFSEDFERHRQIAGYPDELIEALKALMLLSENARKVAASEVVKLLKKYPPVNGGQF
jgi:hypothetical protein